LFSLYFYERYGGLPAVKALVAEPANGIAGYEAVLDDFMYPEDFDDVFADWVVANWLDDGTIGDGRYGYVGEMLPPFSAFATVTSYPAGPFNGAVSHWAADYARYLNGSGLQVTFDGADNSRFAVRAILTDPVTPTEIVDMTLDGAQAGALSLPQIGSTHQDAVLVYAGISSSGGTGYQYGANQGAVAAPSVESSGPLSLRVLGSGSARPSVSYTLPADVAGRPLRIELYDVTGRLVRRLVDAQAVPGHHVLPWGGPSGGSGVYFVRMTAGEDVVNARIAVVR
jgi:hypothetical protein